MCVAIVRLDPDGDVPMVVGFNRDEDPRRDAGMPVVFRCGKRQVLAAREPLHGGTWLGLNDAGLVVGLLNRVAAVACRVLGAGQEGATRSRGLLVLDCLATSDASAVRRVVKGLRGRYEPFNLFAVDGERLLVACYDGRRIEIGDQAPGVHVLGHGRVDDLADARMARVHGACLGGAGRGAAGWVSALKRCLAAHADDPASLESPCRHGTGFRTLCSTVLALGAGLPRRIRMAHAPGPPCTTRYRDLSALAAGLQTA